MLVTFKRFEYCKGLHAPEFDGHVDAAWRKRLTRLGGESDAIDHAGVPF